MRIDFQPDSSFGFKRELDLRLQAAIAARNDALKDSTFPAPRRSTLRYAVQSAKTLIEPEKDFFIRTITFAINLEVMEDSTVWVKSFAKSRRDTLLEQEVELIEDSRYPEMRFQTPQNLFSRAIFPTLATASLGVIVFLFFNVRSN